MKGIFEKKDYSGFIAKYIKGLRSVPPMFHPHVEILFVTKGKVNMMIDSKELVVNTGEISIVFPYAVHSYEAAPDAELYIMMFEPRIAYPFENELLSKKPLNPHITDCRELFDVFEKIYTLLSNQDELKLKTATSYLSAIVGEVLCKMPLYDVEGVSENMTIPILIYCSEHFCDEDISLNKISNELYISKGYVSKIFSYKIKYGFREYINELRISKAKELLSKTDMKIINVMLECGFKNQSSFNRIFYEICGTSPREYRQQKQTQKIKRDT